MELYICGASASILTDATISLILIPLVVKQGLEFLIFSGKSVLVA